MIVITGAGSGIGREVARLAARSGSDVALLDRDAAAVGSAAAEVREDAAAGHVVGLGCDVADEDQVTSAFSRLVEGHGPPRGVVCSAGVDRGGELHELDAAVWDEVHAVNLRGAFLTCRAALRSMIPAGGGSIVCISSPFAYAAAPGTGAYSASKAGVCALVRVLAVEHGGRGIRANAVLPGPTETDLMWSNVDPENVPAVRATVEREVPLGRLASPEEPARAALWLLSDDASFVTGSQLACDGGVLAKSSVSV